MKNKIRTSIEFTKSILTTGAFKETSKKVEVEICSLLPKEENRVIVEFGIGHGNLTRKILRTISPGSRLIAFEVNADFCAYVAQKVNDERLTIINDGAENLLQYVKPPIHGVISSIPLTLMPKDLRKSILESTYSALAERAYFSQVLYSKVHQNMLNKVFDKCTVARFINVPFEYVYHCQRLSDGE